MLRTFTLGFAGLLVAVGSLARAEDLLVEVDRTRLHTGLVLLLGADDLKAADGLVHTGRYLVRQLVDADRVAPLRREALDGGLHGPLSIAALPADGRLPYPSRFVDLVVADPKSPGCPPLAELHRVTNVGGRLLLRDGDGWKITSR